MFSPPQIDCATVADDELTALLVESARWRSALDAFEARLLAEFDRRHLARHRGHADSSAWLTSHTHVAAGTARCRIHAAGVLGDLPLVVEALASGAINEAHVKAFTRAVRDVGIDAVVTDQDMLIDWACRLEPERFGRKVRRWVLEHRVEAGIDPVTARNAERSVRVGIDPAAGTGFIHSELPVDQHAIVTGALWEIVDEQWRAGHPDGDAPPEHAVLTSQQRLADALVEMARRAMSGTGTSTSKRPLVSVLIDFDSLVGKLSATGRCTLSDGTPIDAATARRLACEADILPVVLNGHSQPLDVGRAKRLATFHQRAAMTARSTTCEWPGCQVSASWSQAHHLKPWEEGGLTNIDDLAYLCGRHHHDAHEGGWSVSRDPTGTVVVRAPGDEHDSEDVPEVRADSRVGDDSRVGVDSCVGVDSRVGVDSGVGRSVGAGQPHRGRDGPSPNSDASDTTRVRPSEIQPTSEPTHESPTSNQRAPVADSLDSTASQQQASAKRQRDLEGAGARSPRAPATADPSQPPADVKHEAA